MSLGAYASTVSAIDPNTGHIVEVPIDAAGGYVLQDATGVITTAQLQTTAVHGGKSLLKPELAQHLNSHGYKSAIGRGGFTINAGDSRWMNMNAVRGARTMQRKPVNPATGHLQSTSVSMTSASGLLSLGSRFTPSSAATAFGMNATSGIVTTGSMMTTAGVTSGSFLQSANCLNTAVERDQAYRIAAAITGTSSRGRPRGRRPLRGQFPVVPIDMVRQLGIEQQVILQPAAPVAMRNKAVLCRPLSLSKKTQASIVYDNASNRTMDAHAISSATAAETMEYGERVQQNSDEVLKEATVHQDFGSVGKEATEMATTQTDVSIDDLVGFSQAPAKHYSTADAETSPMEDTPTADLNESGTQTDAEPEVASPAGEEPQMPLFLPIPIPVPIYIPVPVCLYPKPVPWLLPFPLPCLVPIPLVLNGGKTDSVAEDQTTFSEGKADEILQLPSTGSLDRSTGLDPTGEDDAGFLVIAGGDSICIADQLQPETTELPASPVQDSSLKRHAPSSPAPSPPPEPLSQSPTAEMEAEEVEEVDDDDKVEGSSTADPAAPVIDSSVEPSSVELQKETPPTGVSDTPTTMQEPQAKRPRIETPPTPSVPPAAAAAPPPPVLVVSDASYHLKFSYGINAWRHWVQQKLGPLGGAHSHAALLQYPHLRSDLMRMSIEDLNRALSQFVREVRKPNNECYVADSIFYLCLGIQEYLNENGRRINIFGGPTFNDFSTALDNILANFQPRISPEGLLICRIEEEHLWEARQLGDKTPDVLLFSVLYFNTKHFGLRLGSAHSQLTFSHFHFASIRTIDQQVEQIPEDEDEENEEVVCRISHLLPVAGLPEHEETLLRLESNHDFPERCPTRLFKAYMARCPTHVHSSEEAFYFTPRSIPDAELEAEEDSSDGGDAVASWFNADRPLKAHELQVILNRIKMVKEIQEAFMNGQVDGGGF